MPHYGNWLFNVTDRLLNYRLRTKLDFSKIKIYANWLDIREPLVEVLLRLIILFFQSAEASEEIKFFFFVWAR